MEKITGQKIATFAADLDSILQQQHVFTTWLEQLKEKEDVLKKIQHELELLQQLPSLGEK
jgi:hypothetical protein